MISASLIGTKAEKSFLLSDTVILLISYKDIPEALNIAKTEQTFESRWQLY